MYIAPQPDERFFIIHREEITILNECVASVPKSKILARCETLEEAQEKKRKSWRLYEL